MSLPAEQLSLHTIAGIRRMAFTGLPRMYVPEEHMHYFCLRRHPDGSVLPEGRSRRYTAITLIGFRHERPEDVQQMLCGHTAHSVLDRLVSDVETVENLGDVALTAWAAHELHYADRARIWQRLEALKPADRPYPAVELAWLLTAASLDPASDKTGLGPKVAKRLKDAFSHTSGVFPHVVGKNSRAHIACFADMVYPIQALSHYSRLTGDKMALEAAALGAKRICTAQGPAGQWWWHYDYRTGDVVEGYPVYAIHQDAMAPMALFALMDAGGPDYSAAIRKGLEWLWYSPEIGASLVDEKADLIWRKVARREPNKFSRYAQAGVSLLSPAMRMPGLDKIFRPRKVDYEDRPYHLGWLLYAWPAERAVKWDQGGSGS